MLKRLVSFLVYIYIVVFKRGVHVGFPCRVSPFFILKQSKYLKNVSFGNAFIGRDVEVANGCRFYEDPIIYGKVTIGKHTSINGPATRIFAKINKIEIGSFCSIASNVIIQEYNHNIQMLSTYDIPSHIIREDSVCNYTSKGDIIIGDDVWIGSNCSILSGVKIGRGSVIGAGSVVVKDIEPYSIAVGNPARVIKKRFSDDIIKKIEGLNWTEWDDKTIREHHYLFEKCDFANYL